MAQVKERYRSSLDEEMLTGDVTLVPGVPVKIGEYKVQAGEVIGMGFGSQSGLDNAVGRIYADLKDNAATPASLKGKLRFSVYSPQDRPLRILHEFDLDIINDNQTDRTKQTPLPFNQVFLTEDKKLVLEFVSKAAATLKKTNCRMLFDVTQGVV